MRRALRAAVTRHQCPNKARYGTRPPPPGLAAAHLSCCTTCVMRMNWPRGVAPTSKKTRRPWQLSTGVPLGLVDSEGGAWAGPTVEPWLTSIGAERCGEDRWGGGGGARAPPPAGHGGSAGCIGWGGSGASDGPGPASDPACAHDATRRTQSRRMSQPLRSSPPEGMISVWRPLEWLLGVCAHACCMCVSVCVRVGGKRGTSA